MLKMFEESVTEITDIEVLYNYLHGGRAIVKLEAPSGTSHNYVFQKPMNPSEFPDDYIFVYALHDNIKKFYIGVLENDEFRLTRNSRFLPDTDIVKGAFFIIRMMKEPDLFTFTRMRIYNGGCCAKCGRQLESEHYRKLGFGPKCLKKLQSQKEQNQLDGADIDEVPELIQPASKTDWKPLYCPTESDYRGTKV